MKILLIHNKYGKFSGEEAVVEAHIKLLRSNGHEVITYYRSSEELETMPNAKMKAFFSAFNNPKSIKEIKALLSKEQPDVVHIHNLYPLISPAILPVIKKMGFPIVMTVHNYRLLCPNGLFFNKGEICEKCTGPSKELSCITNNCEGSLFKSTGYALRNFWARTKNYYTENVTTFLCLTAFQKNKLVANGFAAEKCEVLPNFYSKELADTAFNISERKYVAFAGRLSPEKGIPLLLDAARQLPHIRFCLAGTAREGYIETLEIPENVILEGMLDAAALSSFYKKARLYVHSSICYEGFPMVFPEAMAYKLPIIAPKMAGYPEVVEEGVTGLLFESGNSIALAKTINDVWENTALIEKMGIEGFNRVQQKYSAASYYKLLLQGYLKAVKN